MYVWIPARSGTATIETCGTGTGFDTVLYMYALSCAGGAEVACNDDACGLGSRLTVSVTAGEMYFIVVDGFTGASGNFTLSVFTHTQIPLVGTLAYVANSGSDSVSVVDASIGTVIDTIALPPGSAPSDIAATVDGQSVYVTNESGNTVSVIDAASGNLVTNVPVGRNPRGIAISRNQQRVYVANSSDRTVSVIDATPQSVTRNTVINTTRLAIALSVFGVAVSPDGQYLYLTHRASASDPASGLEYLLIDAQTGLLSEGESIVFVSGTPRNPLGLAISPDGRTAYVSMSTLDEAFVFALHPFFEEQGRVPVGDLPSAVAVTPDGAFAYVVNVISNNVSVIDTTKQAVGDPQPVIATIPVGLNPLAVAVAANGAYAFVTNRDDDTVSVIDTSENAVVATFGVGDGPRGIALAPLPIPIGECVGDCDGNEDVRVNELVTGINIALGQVALNVCLSFDADENGLVTIDELVRGINNTLRGCR